MTERTKNSSATITPWNILIIALRFRIAMQNYNGNLTLPNFLKELLYFIL